MDLDIGLEPVIDGAGTGGRARLGPVNSGYLRGFTGVARGSRFGTVDFVNFIHAVRIARAARVDRLSG